MYALGTRVKGQKNIGILKNVNVLKGQKNIGILKNVNVHIYMDVRSCRM